MLSTEGLKMELTQSLPLSSGEMGIYRVLKVFFLYGYRGGSVVKSRECLFLPGCGRSIAEELLFKLVMKHELELSSPSPREQEQEGYSWQRDSPSEGVRYIFESPRETTCGVAFRKPGKGGWAAGPCRCRTSDCTLCVPRQPWKGFHLSQRVSPSDF